MGRAEEVYRDDYRTDADARPLPDWKITDGRPVKGLRILSVGSGHARDLWHLAADNEVFALDSSPSAVAVAIQHGVRAAEHDLTQRLPFDDASFDLVVAKDVAEHLVDPMPLFAELRRVLRDTGELVVNVPNHFYFRLRARLLFGGDLRWKAGIHDHSRDFEVWDYMHLRFFTFESFQRFLGAAGFEPRRWYWDFGLLAHYMDPGMFVPFLEAKYRDLGVRSARDRLICHGLLPLVRAGERVFPKRARAAIVGLAPGLLSSCFYARCAKSPAL